MKKENLSTYIIIFISIVGIALCGYLWWLRSLNGIPSCTVSDCETVLSSQWSVFWGIPVVAWGVIFYLSILFLTILNLYFKKNIIFITSFVIIIIGTVFTLYLRYLEFFVIKAWCIWCWVSVILVITFVINYLISVRNGFHSVEYS